MQKTDEELIVAYKNGDDEALRTLISRYTAMIYNFTRRLGAKGDTDDITQEVFVKAWKNLERFDEEKATFKTWIFTIARNSVTDFLRKKKSLSFSDLENDMEEETFSQKIPDTALLPDEILQKLQDVKLLNEIFETLPPNYRIVLDLHYKEEMTFDEIGKVLGKPLNTVKSQHRRALLQLRNLLL
jgi:RNA polymerase sigma-70 factor (ECF subfamily)